MVVHGLFLDGCETCNIILCLEKCLNKGQLDNFSDEFSMVFGEILGRMAVVHSSHTVFLSLVFYL